MPTLTRSRTATVCILAAAGSLAIVQPALAGKKPTATKVTTTVAHSAPAVSASSPVRIAASSTALVDATGQTFGPDSPYAVGGQLVTTLNTVRRTASQPLYQRERLGGSGYAFPVSTPGTYFVDLFVAETQGAQVGQRVWNVTAEGSPAATSVDVVRDAGANVASHVLFAAPVTDGVLNISFDRVAGQPLVGAVEVDFQNSSTTAAATLFSDDFNSAVGTSPDTRKWTAVTGGNGWGNNELQSYTGRASNVATDGAGHLSITARNETYTGSDGLTRNYTSARLQTRDHFAFQYGTAVARMRVPAGQGLLPAFWALGTNIGTVGWPLCGEVDIAEILGSDPTVSHATVHAGATNGGTWLSGTSTAAATPLSDGYHDYGVIWGPNAIAMTLDGRTYMTVSASDPLPTNFWNFNHPFYLLLNLAVGGNWPGAPDATTAFPATLSVDYVRVTG